MKLPQAVIVNELGPRIGLHGEKQILSTEQKLEWIQYLIQSGISSIEVTSFIRPNLIPQFNDSAELFLRLERDKALDFSAYVPERRYLTRAFVVDADQISFCISATEQIKKSGKNKNKNQIVNDLKKMIPICKEYKKTTKTYITNVFGGANDQNVDLRYVITLAEQLLDLGVDEISFCDTTGMSTPLEVSYLLEDLLKVIPIENCVMHFNDSYGRAIANIVTSLGYGVERFDTSNGGFSGITKKLVATEDVVSILHKLGIYTGIDEIKLHKATSFIIEQLNARNTSKLYSVWNSKAQLK